LNQPSSFDEIVLYLRSILNDLPDKRTGKNKRYQMSDAALSAFSVFFTQTPSFLAYQRSMAENKGQNNAQSLFGIHQIPSDNQIRDLLDEVDPRYVFPVFWEIFRLLDNLGYLRQFCSFEDDLLIAMDGTQYFCSNQIHCPHCSTRTFKDGTTQYFHTVVTPVIVCPENTRVIPLVPEFIIPQDGHDKQDCENAAAKRWIQEYGKHFAVRGTTILGDDLYCHQPLCELLLSQQLNFILVCKPDSHKILYEWLEGMPLNTISFKRYRGKICEIYTYCYVNQIPLRDSSDALLVNWCELTITRSDGSLVYKNSFATNHQISDQNVEAIVSAGRARWKIENENNNTLKTKGYNLEHNFGHGQKYLSSLLATFNILAFLFHTLLHLTDKKYQIIRQHLPTRKTFFDDLRALTRYICFDSWDSLLTFMIQGLELELYLNTS
jgi:hypothetical protein